MFVASSLWRLLGFAVLLTVAAGPLWVGGIARPARFDVAAAVQAPAAGRLIFTRDGGLWTLGLVDRQETQVVSRPRVGMILSARLASDGSRLAYAQYEVAERGAPTSDIYIAGPDGSDPRRLLSSDQPGTYYQAPAWTANGRQLYFLYSGGSAMEPIRRIERVDVATSERAPVTEEPGQFDVSPDGRWLVLAHAPSGRPALTLIDLQSGARSALIPSGSFEVITAPRFDPASRTILFSGLSWGTWTQSGWAPARAALDGLFRVSVARAHGPPADLYTIPVAGGAPVRLTNLLLDDPVGAWAPDGSQLALLAAEYLAIMPASASEPTPVLTPGAYGSVDWAP